LYIRIEYIKILTYIIIYEICLYPSFVKLLFDTIVVIITTTTTTTIIIIIIMRKHKK